MIAVSAIIIHAPFMKNTMADKIKIVILIILSSVPLEIMLQEPLILKVFVNV